MRLLKKSTFTAAFRAVNASRKNDNILVRFDYDWTNMLGIIIESFGNGSHLAVKFHPRIMEEDMAVRAVLDGVKFREVMQRLNAKVRDRIEMKFDHAMSSVKILVNGTVQAFVDFQAVNDAKINYTRHGLHNYDGEHFANLLNYLTAFTSDDKKREVLHYVNINENGSRLMATNGRIVGRINDLNPRHDKEFEKVNIYKTMAEEAMNVLDKNRGRCVVSRFEAENINGYYGLTDGSACMINKLTFEYPQAERAYFDDGLPKYKIFIENKNLAAAVKSMNKINMFDNKKITMSISDNLKTLRLCQKDEILNDISADIEIKHAEAINIPPESEIVFDQISLSVEYLHTILKGLNEDTIILRFVLSNGGNEDTKDSLMFPTRINPLFIEAPSINGDMLIMPLRS